MPTYDCGAADCEECQKAFGPDRSKAIAEYEARGRYYEELQSRFNATKLDKELSQ